MFIPAVFVGILFINKLSRLQSDAQYTEEDFAVIRGIIQSLQINHLIIVTDRKNLGLINFLKYNLYSAVISSGELNEILNAEDKVGDLFPTSTVIVSKEILNYTIIFQRFSEKHLPACVVFANSLEPLQEFYIPMNTEFYVVQYTPHTTIINKAYHVKPGLNITLMPLSTWQRGNTDIVTLNRSRTYDFGGVTLRMLHFMNHECKNLMSIPMLDRIDCFHQEIFRILRDRLNYRIRKVNCVEKVYPYNYPNGTLSCLFTMLNSQKIDFSSGSYIINTNRLSQYDFAWPTFTSKSMLYIKERKQSVWKGYLRPIHKYLWYAICVWIVGIGLLNQLFHECHENTFKPRLSFFPDLVKSVFTSLQVFCSQGLSDKPKWFSNRILFITSFFLFVIFEQIYSGFLISFLMIDLPNIPFTDINGFLRNGKFKLLSLNTGFHHYLSSKILQNRNIDVAKFKLPIEQLPGRVNEAIGQLCNNTQLTYIEFRENIVMHDIPCKITELPRPIMYQSIGIGFGKYSPYREPIQQGITTLYAAGVLQRMRKQLLSYVHLKERETSNEDYVKVSLKHVVSVFFILTMGMMFAWGLFLLEHLFNFSLKHSRGVKNRKARPKLRKKFRLDYQKIDWK